MNRWKRIAADILFLALAGCVGCERPPETELDFSALTARDQPESKVPAAIYDKPKAASKLSPPVSPAPKKNERDQERTGIKKPEQEKLAVFTAWPQPEVAIIVSGNQHGYVEPCGCTGLANQKGGLARRHTFLEQLAKKRWELLPIDSGNQVRRFGRQAELQFQLTCDALKAMNYKAVGIGEEDLRLSAGEVAAAIANETGPFVSANVSLVDRSLIPQQLIVTVGSRKIGITSVVSDKSLESLGEGEIVKENTAAALKQVYAQWKEAKCNYRIVMLYGTAAEARTIAKQQAVDLIVLSGEGGEPTFEPEKIAGTKSLLLQTGVKGMYVCVLGLYDDAKQPWRYERIPLDARFADSKPMQELMAGYQDQLKELGLDGLGVTPLPHANGREFVGTKVCGECHTKAMAVWEKSEHAHATDSLIHPAERSSIARHYDPECLSCHVTGWSPQKFFPYKSGYLGVDKTPLLMESGCENCHGPGSEHVAAESGDGKKFTPDMIARLRASMRLPLAGETAKHKCMECHDIDNSPDFHPAGAFEKYWKEIEHIGKD